MSSSPLRITPSVPDLIRDSAVAYSRRLARICPEEFVELVERHGGHAVDSLDGSPSVLVIGEHDAMLAADYTPGVAMSRGEAKLIAEREFLEALGVGEGSEIRKGLERLRTWMPDSDRALEQLAVVEQAGPMLIRLEDGELADTSGQFHFDFTGEYEQAASLLMPGITSTAGERDEAYYAFRQAIRFDPDHAQAHYNLADTLDELGRCHEPLAHWRAYAPLDPVSAWGQYARSRLAWGSARDPIWSARSAGKSRCLPDPSSALMRRGTHDRRREEQRRTRRSRLPDAHRAEGDYPASIRRNRWAD